jgi:hypothetical protein
MKFTGTITVDISEMGVYEVRDQGKDRSNGLIYVPKNWVKKQVMVLLLSNNEKGE